MALTFPRRARRPQAIAFACVSLFAAVCTVTLSAAAPVSAAPRSGLPRSGAQAGPLAHAPGFRQSFGQQVLASPGGVALDPRGAVWVADPGHARVVEFTPSGHLVTSLRLTAQAGGLDQPEGITVDAAGHIFVADTGHHRVIELSAADRVLVTLGAAGSGRGRLSAPVAVAVSPFGYVWVADQGSSRAVEYTANGLYRTSIPVPNPAGSALAARGDVWVSSPAYAPANAVYEFSPAGRRLRAFGTTQAGYGDFGNLGGIAVGPAGQLYVAQPDYGLVTEFSPGGRFVTEFGLQPQVARASQDLEFPQALAVTVKDQIWVADSGRDQVAEFGSVPGSAAPAAPVVPGPPSIVVIIGECLLALILIGLGWFLARH